MSITDVAAEQAPLIGTVTGVVERGDQRGRLIGFPTANIPISTQYPEGVYAGLIRIEGLGDTRSFVTAVSIGRRETYYRAGGELLLEAFIVDFAEDVYGRTVHVELHRFMRTQQRFDGTDHLVRSLRRDVKDVRRWARADGYGHLMTTGSAPRAGRWGPDEPRRPRDHARAAHARDVARLALIRRAVAAATHVEMVDHAWVAEWTGLPERYIAWLFPTLEELRSAGTPGDERTA